jgi:hypothetical protein
MKAARLAEIFDVSLFDANLALLIIRGRWQPEHSPKRFPRTCTWLEQCYHRPRNSEIKLAALDELLRTYGVEPIRIEDAFIDRYYYDIVASYLNTGETYATTLLLDHDEQRWTLASWGDFLEANESKYNS